MFRTTDSGETQHQPVHVWSLVRILQKFQQGFDSLLVLHHELLLAAQAICEGLTQQPKQLLLLGWVEACQHWDVVLLLWAKTLILAAEIDKFSMHEG